jgi:hypothetical protein
MRKICFYTLANKWAFATIHRGLEKELYKHGIMANSLDWTQPYSPEEFSLLNQTYDLFVTNPEAVIHLYNSGIPLEKIATVAHGQWDMLLARRDGGVNFYNSLYKFGVVSDILKSKAREFGIARIPDVLTMGIHFDMFYRKPSDSLARIGYAGAREVNNFFGQEIKRGHLVKNTINSLQGVRLIEHGFYNWMAMPAYYNSVDAIVVSSTEESAGLPSMEAAAAGRLVLSTPVGYFEQNGELGGGIVLPLEEDSFTKSLADNVKWYTSSPDAYHKKCLEIQEYARENYDWSKHIQAWVDFLS